ncbi:MAG: 4-hydroxy-tetrahydrodipicolinate reductase, partial [Tidjanibacter sp.]|nr:4-hydroxy-tetrahydrodipicolinate reductase [Tidjanibacter sp.]
LELKHSAKSRRGLVLGAVLAAEFLQGKQGVFSMDDMLKF